MTHHTKLYHPANPNPGSADDTRLEAPRFSARGSVYLRPGKIVTQQLGGYRDDAGKIRWDLLPPELMEETAKALAFGAEKYDERDWEKGTAWGRPFAALMRHMWAWWRGANGGKDPETGLSHLAHAAANIAFLITFEKRKVGEDDRPIQDDQKAV